MLGHEGNFSPDGNTYWSTGLFGGSITAIDISDPRRPRILYTGLWGFIWNHGIEFSPDGMRAYLANGLPGGLIVLDVSDIQDRVPIPTVRQVAALNWNIASVGQHALPVFYAGKPHLFVADEFASEGVRVFDLSDETDPRLVSQIQLEIQRPEHHDQAILMAQIMMAKPASRLGRLATAIQTKQLIEVGHMQAWLMLARQPLLPKSTEMDWMLLAPVPPDQGLLDYLAACRTAKGMPGMASTGELNQLRETQGETADRLFIELMIRHHHGALPMAAFASKHAETAQVRALALSIRMEQEREMLHLRGLLDSRFASSR